MVCSPFPSLLALSASALALLATSPALAQGWSGGWTSTGGGWGTPVSQPGYIPPSPAGRQPSSNLEVGTLYVASAAYGVGAGIWLATELGVKDPGLAFIAPAVLGVAGPVGVYFLDEPKLPRGVPGAISLGLTLGALEGTHLWLYQYTSAKEADAWGGRAFARSVLLGSTLGGAAGAAVGFLEEPSPKLSLFVGSGGLWGSAIGSMIGYGTSSGETYGDRNDALTLGNLVGLNVGIAATGALSTVWIPGYKQMTYMWAGAGVGFAATLPIYLFYAGNENPARRGLIAQGIGTTLGIAAGGIFTFYDRDWDTTSHQDSSQRRFASLEGVAPMALPGGLGMQMTGLLF
ncbi:MAG: hypothetical protein NZX77_09615 [Polyangiaceae bacterium]|nr:hypothetical protein [Polyangiaceae bacterium]